MAPAFVRTIGRGTLPWYCLNGLGLAFCLMANGIFDRVVSQRSSVATFAVRISADDPLTGGLTAIAACAVLALAALRYHRELRVGYVVGAVGAVVQVVCLAGIYLASGGVIPLGLGTAAGLVLGAASVLFLALWAQLLAHSGLHRALTVLAMALAADTLFDLASALLVEGAVVALSAVAFAAGPLLLAAAFSAEKALGMAGDPGAGGSLGVAAPPTPDAARVTVPTPARPHASSLALGVLCLAVYGFAMGRVQSTGSDFAVVGLASLLMDHAVNLGALVAAGAAVLAARLKDPAGFLRMAVLVLLLAALYLSGVFGVVVGPAGMVVMSVARIVAFVYVWLLSAQAGAPGLPPNRPAFAFAAGWGVFSLANTVSTRLGLSLFANGPWFMVYNVLVVGCLVALVLVEIVPRRQAAGHAAGAADPAHAPDTSAATTESQDDARLARLAAEYGLTAREVEVLAPLVRGRSAATIGAALGMSTETARTHIRHIYQKTDVHGREELMDLVEQER